MRIFRTGKSRRKVEHSGLIKPKHVPSATKDSVNADPAKKMRSKSISDPNFITSLQQIGQLGSAEYHAARSGRLYKDFYIAPKPSENTLIFNDTDFNISKCKVRYQVIKEPSLLSQLQTKEN